MEGTSLELLANYGWMAISVVLAGAVVYLYKQQRRDHQQVTALYEKWIASNNETNARIDRLLADYRQLLERMAAVIQKAVDNFGIEDENGGK